MLTDGIGSDNREEFSCGSFQCNVVCDFQGSSSDLKKAEAGAGVGQPGGTDAAGDNHPTLPASLRYPLVSASSEVAGCSGSETPQPVSADATCVAGNDSDGGWQGYSAGAVLAAAVAPGYGEGHNGECGLISLHVSDNLLAGSTGCHVWEASFALAQWVLGHPERFRGRRVLELGCGAGLVAMALHRAGAAWVAATDGSDAAVANCAANLRLNGVCSVHVMQSAAETPLGHKLSPPKGVAAFRLAWEEPLEVAALNCEVAVASDVLYDPEIVPVFVALLAHLLRTWSGPEGSVPPQQQQHQVQEVFIATVCRNPATLNLFLRSVEELSLHIESVDWRDSCVAFHHVPALTDPQLAQRILLHRVTYRK
ncbi:hypothetical protein Vafri_20064 [Volvox africanus]|nr:hypothetical protein Vafri_20064 [Volvox africanus]